MSYTPTSWTTGDTITASALNKIEQGIADAGGGGAVIITDNGTALDKTYAEIYALVESGTPCYISYTAGKASGGLDETYTYKVVLFPVVLVYKYNNDYRVMAVSSSQGSVSPHSYVGLPAIWTYMASNSSAYPTFLKQAYVNEQYLSASSYRDI